MAGKNLNWREAVIEVLKAAGKPLHYTVNCGGGSERERVAIGLGMNFLRTLLTRRLPCSLQNEKASSQFIRVGRGMIAFASN